MKFIFQSLNEFYTVIIHMYMFKQVKFRLATNPFEFGKH